MVAEQSKLEHAAAMDVSAGMPTAEDLERRGALLSKLQAQVDDLVATLTQKHQQIAAIAGTIEREFAELAAENAALRQRLAESGDGPGETASLDTEAPKTRQLPSLTTMAGNLAKAAAKAATTAVRGDRLFASPDVVRQRLAVCRSGECDRYVRDSDRCAECGCFVAPKAKLATEDCPLGRWSGDNVTRDLGAAERAPTLEGSARPAESAPVAADLVPQPSATQLIRVMLFASPERCPACAAARQLLYDFRSSSATARLEIEEINPAHAPELARRYEVATVPTFLFFRGSQLRRRYEGLPSESDLELDVRATASDRGTLAARTPSDVALGSNQDAPPHPAGRRAADSTPSLASLPIRASAPHVPLEIQQAKAELARLSSSARRGAR